LAAALRVAKNHGKGPAFQRVLCAQARFFEANGALRPSHQGQRRFFRRADQYASVYRHGVTGPVAEFAVKQYRSHRGVKKMETEVAEANWKKKT
jgi:hypothetical protein